MKLTISVPDDLWRQALQTSQVGPSPSAIVQNALKRALENTSQPQLDEDTAELFELAQRKIRDSAETSYNSGYRMGLQLALELGNWDRLRGLAENGILATLANTWEALREQLLDGTYPRHQRSPFVLDKRTEEFEEWAGTDEDGDWIDIDQASRWLHSIVIEKDGTVVGPPGPDTVHPLLVLGTDAALRAVFAAATPQ